MSTKETLPTTCLICGKGVPDYVAQFCCSGTDCGCHGQPLDPCVCSQECYDAVIKGIGKPFEQRRADYITALRTRLDAAETWKAKQQKALIAMALELCSTQGPGVIDGIRQLKNRLDAAEKELVFHSHRCEESHNEGQAGMPQGNCQCLICAGFYNELTQLKERLSEVSKGTLMVENLRLKEANAVAEKELADLKWQNEQNLEAFKNRSKLKTYVQQQASTADANSHEWQLDQASGITDINAAYRAGMWYAYRDVLNRLPQVEPISESLTRRIYALESAFCHNHVSNGENDLCKTCGFDLRDTIHNRLEHADTRTYPHEL